MSKKVLIVGGDGYLGRHLYTVLLKQNYSVTITGVKKKINGEPLNHSPVVYYYLDFTKPESFTWLSSKKYDLVIILASLITGIGKTDLTDIDIEVNSLGLMRFLSYLQNNPISENFIYISSMTVYSEKNTSPVKENDILQPINSYGLSKLIAENFFSFFCKAGDLKGIIIRPPGLYGGDRKSGFIYNIIKTLENNNEFYVNSEGLGYWETININDFVAMIIEFLKEYSWERNIDVFNFSYGEETDFYETARFIANRLGKQEKLFIHEKDKGYQKLFLCNEKLLKHIHSDFCFKQSLINYIDKLK